MPCSQRDLEDIHIDARRPAEDISVVPSSLYTEMTSSKKKSFLLTIITLTITEINEQEQSVLIQYQTDTGSTERHARKNSLDNGLTA